MTDLSTKPLAMWLRLPKLSAAGSICGLWLLIIVIAGFAGPAILGIDPNGVDLLARLRPPVGFGGTVDHLLGTDQLGRDILIRICHAVRVSLLLALFGTLIGAAIGISTGFLAAHFGGVVDDVISTLIDFQAAMPFLILAIAAVATLGSNIAVLLVLVSVFGWERYARLSRGLALSYLNNGYVVAAQTYGAGWGTIYSRHILLNILAILIVNITLTFPEILMLETTLSFLGLGVQPPHASLGSMMNYGRDQLFKAWWISILPGLAIFLTTLAVSTIGDILSNRLSIDRR
ncbi:ABC transporter permease [Rhizobium terrae]|uniref:ABC transporter permease n=1 Tax=Rhizobium terrae TaxID=2171756 RepID=UPI000E3CF4B9|nr:ABC transporter permease [Rhizobium terrae]